MSDDDQPSIRGSSAVMAAGTVVSRLSGFGRGILLAAALGSGLHADVFNIANTVPNMVYILLAGGIFNAVLVPQLVRAQKSDPDGGEAYTNRLVTIAALFLGIVTVVLVLAAPLVMSLFLSAKFDTAELAAQRESVVDFARYCLPQVFFYGMFVLAGQILNARGRFGPMMWAPIANNIISMGVLVAYLLSYGPATKAEQAGGFESGQELLLGLGSTAGIVVQLLVLIPYLRAAGLRFTPRLDLRDSGLGHTLRLGLWTVLFVIVNQIAYTVVVRLASDGTAGGGTGYTIYSNSYLLVMVPHSVITVSLATAILPRLSAYAADRDYARISRTLAATARSAYALVVPGAALLALCALPTAHVVWGIGATAQTYPDYVPTLRLFAMSLVLFTCHYLMLRGFYALEQTRRVFWIQCVIAAVNIVAAVLLTRDIDPIQTAPRLVLAYAIAYGAGATCSALLLSRTVGGLEGGQTLRFFVRLGLVTGWAALAGWLVLFAADDLSRSWGADALRVLATTAAFGVMFLLGARLLRLREVDSVTRLITGRLRGSRGS